MWRGGERVAMWKATLLSYTPSFPFLWWILPSRAYVSALGFLDGLKEQGVLDCTTYFSSLSGSSWLVAPLSDSFWVLFFSSLSLLLLSLPSFPSSHLFSLLPFLISFELIDSLRIWRRLLPCWKIKRWRSLMYSTLFVRYRVLLLLLLILIPN